MHVHEALSSKSVLAKSNQKNGRTISEVENSIKVGSKIEKFLGSSKSVAK